MENKQEIMRLRAVGRSGGGIYMMYELRKEIDRDSEKMWESMRYFQNQMATTKKNSKEYRDAHKSFIHFSARYNTFREIYRKIDDMISREELQYDKNITKKNTL